MFSLVLAKDKPTIHNFPKGKGPKKNLFSVVFYYKGGLAEVWKNYEVFFINNFLLECSSMILDPKTCFRIEAHMLPLYLYICIRIHIYIGIPKWITLFSQTLRQPNKFAFSAADPRLSAASPFLGSPYNAVSGSGPSVLRNFNPGIFGTGFLQNPGIPGFFGTGLS